VVQRDSSTELAEKTIQQELMSVASGGAASRLNDLKGTSNRHPTPSAGRAIKSGPFKIFGAQEMNAIETLKNSVKLAFSILCSVAVLAAALVLLLALLLEEYGTLSLSRSARESAVDIV
jgi:hypothetical protein